MWFPSSPRPATAVCVISQGAINGLLAYSIVYNSSIDIRLAERVIKRAVKVEESTKVLTLDEIVEAVCNHYKVTVAAVNSKSRKREYVEARQVAMYHGSETHQDACFESGQTHW